MLQRPLLVGLIDEEVRREAELLRTRLLATEPTLFGRVDRLRAEAEFRSAIGWPLLRLRAR